MFFDAHTDIWTDIVQSRARGITGRLKNFHYPRMRQAGMYGGIFVVWVDPPHDAEPQLRTLEIVKAMAAEVYESSDVALLIRTYTDFEKAMADGKLAVVGGMEGLAAIGDSVEWLYALHLLGIRHASLTWNEENTLATGARGTPERGLTPSGREALALMEKLGMLVDVSHANEKSFWQIHESTTRPYIASHSNCKSLCANRRNLTDEQLRAIASRGGVVGVNAYSPFIHDTPTRQTAAGLVDNIDHMVNSMGLEHVGFGFDFGDYLTSDTLVHFQEGDNYEAKGLENVEKVPVLLQEMERRGYSADAMKKICRGNMLRVFQEILHP